MEQVTGIEPALKAWEALILPLNYTCGSECVSSIMSGGWQAFFRDVDKFFLIIIPTSLDFMRLFLSFFLLFFFL